jgi:hypothetical protein
LGAPIFDKILFDAILVFLATIKTFLCRQEYSAILTVYHLDVSIDSMSVFLVEILYGELKVVRDAPFDFFDKVLFALFNEVHNYNIFNNLEELDWLG